MNTCDTCHWYYCYQDGVLVSDEGWGICVWHNGSKRTPAQQIRAGKSDTVLLQVRHDFGCVQWEVDKRVAAET